MNLKELFAAASELPLEQRAKFIDEQCAGDAQMRAAVEELLRAHDSAGVFLAGPTMTPSRPAAAARTERRQIGPYKLLQEIGEGGFGTVWMAEQEQPVRRRVALKIIKLGMDTEQVIARFDAEKQALAMMDHPGIARVFDAGATETGRPYFVMELVAGLPINVYCDKHQLTNRQRIELFIEVCEAVQHAHTKGIIHRDLKPSNVLVEERDAKLVPKVIDFGVAKAMSQRLTERTLFTEQGQLVGTPEYMSPEQAEISALDIDTRTDIYALGVMLYELLSGALPFDSRTFRAAAFSEMQRIIREVDPPRPSTRLSGLGEGAGEIARRRHTRRQMLVRELRSELEWIPLKAMRKERNQRYRSASEMADDLRNYLAGRPLRAGPESVIYRARKYLRRYRAAASVAAAVLAMLVIGLTMYIRDIRAEQAKTRAALADAQSANQNMQAVNEFLTNDLLGAANPARGQGKKLTVDEVVDTAAATVAEKFKDRPLVEAAVRSSLALTYDSLGRDDVALPHARAALDIHRRLLGNLDPQTLESTHRVALLMQNSGSFSESEALYREAIDNGNRLLGADHPEVMVWTADYIRTLDDMGRYTEAETMARDSMARRRRVLGNEHRDTLVSINVLAGILTKQKKYDEARQLFDEALQVRRKVLGELHPETINSLSDMATMLQGQDKAAEAVPLLREAVEKFTKVAGPDHPNTLIAMQNLAVSVLDTGKVDEAVAILTDAVQRGQRALGNEHAIALAAQISLARALEDQRKYVEAEELDRALLERCRRVLGPDHPYTRRVLHNLGRALVKQERWGDAESAFQQGLADNLRLYGPDHPETQAARTSLATVQRMASSRPSTQASRNAP